jgi:hypothetical protein
MRRRRRANEAKTVTSRQHAPAVERGEQVRSGRSAAGPTQRCNARPTPHAAATPPSPETVVTQARWQREIAGWAQGLANVRGPILPKGLGATPF